ncbi:ferritin family protein [Niveibacterium sp. 24ML]|uniref:ferritin-like domain-containing protein n=1 Tax=Niveibacterium sp. 24ML TaxID=2985512 RepID=UPI002270005B|nr:ferritin family protein [Niveibacterium sp. 24ML]MCX9156995.1 ferritin family protein [Niveibacterium sp. 24ML]
MSLRQIRSVSEFYSFAIAIEREAISTYSGFAERMEALGNTETAELFREIARQEAGHAQELERCADGFRLGDALAMSAPSTSITPDGTEIAFESLDPRGAVEVAMNAERRALSFYQNVSLTSPDAAVRELAEGMILEEFEHLRLLERLSLRLGGTANH